MRRAAAIVLLLAVAAPTAGASSLNATLVAERVYLSGPLSLVAAGPFALSLLNLDRAPAFELEGDVAVTLHRATYARAGNALVQQPGGESSTPSHHADARGRIVGWGEHAAMVVRSQSGQVRLDAEPQAAPLSRGGADRDLRVGIETEVGADATSFEDHYRTRVSADALALTSRDYAGPVQAEGAFELLLFDVVVELTSDGRRETITTGFHEEESTGIAARTHYDRATLAVTRGRLVLAEGAPAVHVPAATITGDGTLTLTHATGIVRGAKTHDLKASDAEFEGSYTLHVQPSTGGYEMRLAGALVHNLAPAATGATPKGSAWVWLVWVAGAVLAAGAGGGTMAWYRARRKSSDAIQASDPLALSWADLSQEFSVVRAGERAGVVVVLVAADRVAGFLQAVVRRGLMAEDTGDRVRAGAHELAVVAIEPSPVMLN